MMTHAWKMSAIVIASSAKKKHMTLQKFKKVVF